MLHIVHHMAHYVVHHLLVHYISGLAHRTVWQPLFGLDINEFLDGDKVRVGRPRRNRPRARVLARDRVAVDIPREKGRVDDALRGRLGGGRRRRQRDDAQRRSS